MQIFLSRGGYFKKITPLSLRLGGEQKYKEDDGPSQCFEATNRGEILVLPTGSRSIRRGSATLRI